MVLIMISICFCWLFCCVLTNLVSFMAYEEPKTYFAFLLLALSNSLFRLWTSLLSKAISVPTCSWFCSMTVAFKVVCTSASSVFNSVTVLVNHFTVRWSFLSCEDNCGSCWSLFTVDFDNVPFRSCSISIL